MPPKNKQNNKSKKKAPVPKKLNVPEVEWALQTQAQRAETIKEIKTKFGALGLKNVEIVEGKETQQPQGLSAMQLTAVGSCTEAQGKELSKFSNLMDVFDKFEVEVANVVIGSKMPFLVTAYDLENKDHTILEDRRGKFVVIQFWAPWNERCQKSAAKMLEVVKKRGAEWANKVAFLTVACDTTLDKLKTALSSRAWTDLPNVKHLFSGESDGKEDSDDIITKYELEDLPVCLIIDGEGKLARRGDIEDWDLEVVLEKYLAGDLNYEGKARIPEANTWQACPADKRAQLSDQVCAALKAEPGFSELALVITDARIHPVIGSLIQEESCITLMGKVEVAVEKKVAEVCKIFRDANVTDLDQIVMVTAPQGPVEPTAACWLCKKAFTAEDVRWHCAMCSPAVTMCTTCINNARKAPKECTHPAYHPWFRIGPQSTPEDLQSLEYSMGRFACAMTDEAEEEKKAQAAPHEGKQDKPPGNGVVHEDVFCNGCKKGPISDMPRWKCCSCADFDFCDECFSKHIQNTPAPKKAPKKKGAKGGKQTKDPIAHEQRHVFLRIDDSELVRLADEDEDEGDAEFDEGDLDMLSRAIGDDDDIEGFDGTEAIAQKIREMAVGEEEDEEDDEPLTSKGKPKIREVTNEDEESAEEPEVVKAGSDEDSEAEDDAPAKPKPTKAKPKAKQGKAAKAGSEEDSEAEDELNQLTEEAAQVPLPEDDEDF